VKSPISGVTSLQQLPEGSLVGTGADGLLTSITQLDPVYVNFSVSEREGAEIRKLLERGEASPEADKLRVRISFGDGEFYDREASIDFTSSVIDVETGTLQARAVVFNPNRRLVPGQFVRATVVGLTLPNVIVAPEKALMQGPQGQFVYTVNAAGAAELRPVTLDRKIEGGWIIASGLKENDRLITEGVIKVRPGAPVTAQAATQPAPNAAASR
jgi:membrane fusion protein (multidrug efflux system)